MQDEGYNVLTSYEISESELFNLYNQWSMVERDIEYTISTIYNLNQKLDEYKNNPNCLPILRKFKKELESEIKSLNKIIDNL